MLELWLTEYSRARCALTTRAARRMTPAIRGRHSRRAMRSPTSAPGRRARRADAAARSSGESSTTLDGRHGLGPRRSRGRARLGPAAHAPGGRPRRALADGRRKARDLDGLPARRSLAGDPRRRDRQGGRRHRLRARLLRRPDRQRFEADEQLGIASGTCYERENGSWVRRTKADTTVWGATRAYRATASPTLEALEPCMGWDGLDELRVQLRGHAHADVRGPPLPPSPPRGRPRDDARCTRAMRWVAPPGTWATGRPT